MVSSKEAATTSPSRTVAMISVDILNPSEHPASNGVIERFHQELGKLCRIFNLPPHIAYEKLNTTSAKLQFHSFLKTKYHDPINRVMED